MLPPSSGSRAADSGDVVWFIFGQLRSRSEQAAAFCRIGAQLIEPGSPADHAHDMTRAELTAEISEFHALFLRALLGTLEGWDSQRVHDYLDMAEVATGWPHERAAVAQARVEYDLRPLNLRGFVERCVQSLDLHCDVYGQLAA